MALEFHKLTGQVDRMGEYFAAQEEETQDKLAVALEIMAQFAGKKEIAQVQRMVKDAVDRDAGYRGARPIDEPIMSAYAPAPLPVSATLMATDGSQIPPDRHGPAVYYLINTGTIIVQHGSGEPPEVQSDPALYYDVGETYLSGGGMITAVTVTARRTVAEMMALAEYAWRHRGSARPLVALLDNPLLLIGMGEDVPEQDDLRALYFDAMNRLLDVNAGLAGYTDRPFSRYVVSMLHLLDLNLQQASITRHTLSNNGRLEGLLDQTLFRAIRSTDGRSLLAPGYRSALFVQMSPLNKAFRFEGGDTHEIAFFYINVAAHGQPPLLARVEIPMWVAADRTLVAEIQALLYHQCQQVASRYPYILTRAHELAVVKHEEAQQLEVMVRVAMTRHGIEAAASEKQAGKNAVSGARSRFEM